jgi:hypothetical protein
MSSRWRVRVLAPAVPAAATLASAAVPWLSTRSTARRGRISNAAPCAATVRLTADDEATILAASAASPSRWLAAVPAGTPRAAQSVAINE